MDDTILSIIKAIQQTATTTPCKKTIQKLMYLIQEANKMRVFDYSIHFYGPYSADLDSEILYHYNCGDLDIDFTDHGHKISIVNPQNVPPIDSEIKKIIENFSSKKPSELELLATTLYIQRAIPNANAEIIVDNVVKIKADKYSKSEIIEAIKELNNKKYFLT